MLDAGSARPVYRNIPQFQIDNAIAMIAEWSRELGLNKVVREIQRGMNEESIVYAYTHR